MLSLLLSACGAGSTDAGPTGRVALSPRAHLVRASMALKGTRPSLEELQRVHVKNLINRRQIGKPPMDRVRKKKRRKRKKGKGKRRERREKWGREGEGGRERRVLAGLGSSCFSLAGCFLRYSALLCTSLLPLPAEPLPNSPRPASLSPSRKLAPHTRPSRLVLQLPAGRGRAAAVCANLATRSSFFMALSFFMKRAPLYRGVHIQPFPILQRKISRM